MMNISELTLPEVWNKCWDSFSIIQIYWNDEIIWDDSLDLGQWENPKEAFGLWAACNPNYKKYIVTHINIEIADFHHAIVKIYGTEENE